MRGASSPEVRVKTPTASTRRVAEAATATFNKRAKHSRTTALEQLSPLAPKSSHAISSFCLYNTNPISNMTSAALRQRTLTRRCYSVHPGLIANVPNLNPRDTYDTIVLEFAVGT